ncbi:MULTISPECIES: hypothetical protein [Cupriavidus]|uniref:Uncharacterized protein n=1 Tax=Cupriavidus oxalaticus TaxID=96344 RepID=A0A4P7L5T0_9BURK|nr:MULTISPECIES: hypothetical protein [Cupriavidus]MBF6988396.1 hypothetical protein [Cupriavidus sp. IK-TO18]QBY50894.1 hypothetical protein E0W60_06940 [Cupriavidus oxalaticus]
MATVNVPNASTQHAAALARILQVTQQAWGLGQENKRSIASATGLGVAPKLSRRARLARAAARAFEAQVMAIRCRQVFVG